MKLSELSAALNNLSSLDLKLPAGGSIPPHFHITELGLTTRHSIDCGGITRKDEYATMQVWVAGDTGHRLTPAKLNGIIKMAAPLMQGKDPVVEVEYQQGTIGRFGLQVAGGFLQLTATQTDCRAKDECGIPAEKRKQNLAELPVTAGACCTPGGGCC